jgi:hypothetical protein
MNTLIAIGTNLVCLVFRRSSGRKWPYCAGFFQDIDDVSTGWQIFGFLWMTVTMSFAT